MIDAQKRKRRGRQIGHKNAYYRPQFGTRAGMPGQASVCWASWVRGTRPGDRLDDCDVAGQKIDSVIYAASPRQPTRVSRRKEKSSLCERKTAREVSSWPAAARKAIVAARIVQLVERRVNESWEGRSNRGGRRDGRDNNRGARYAKVGPRSAILVWAVNQISIQPIGLCANNTGISVLD